MSYLTFKESREIVRNEKLKNQSEWRSWIKGKSKEYKIPTNPNTHYTEEWISFKDWLNSENDWPNNRIYYSYRECFDIIKNLKFKNRKEFYNFIKNNNNDKKIPNRPDHVYKHKGWENWHTFLSLKKLPPIQKSKQFISFKEAKLHLKELKLKQRIEYIEYIDNNNIDFLPKRPDFVYREDWKGYTDYLNYESNRTSFGEKRVKLFLDKNNISYEMEKKFETCKNKKELPFDFYLPKYNLCIEYDGELHYKSSSIYGGDKTLYKIRKNDDIKTNWCKQNNIKLIRIPYNKKSKIFDILKSELL